MEREFILDTDKTVEFPIKITFNDGAFSVHEDGEGFYKIFSYVADGDNFKKDEVLHFDRQQLQCLFYILSVPCDES